MEDENPPSDEDQQAMARMLYFANLMVQLTQSNRFRLFFEANYEVQKQMNEDEGTIDFMLVERPPELAAEVLQGMLSKASKEDTGIVLSTMGDLKALEKNKNVS